MTWREAIKRVIRDKREAESTTVTDPGYDAALQEHEDHATLDCGCHLGYTDAGSAAMSGWIPLPARGRSSDTTPVTAWATNTAGG